MTFYTLEEVANHNTKESCWIVANNNDYDATNFIRFFLAPKIEDF